MSGCPLLMQGVATRYGAVSMESSMVDSLPNAMRCSILRKFVTPVHRILSMLCGQEAGSVPWSATADVQVGRARSLWKARDLTSHQWLTRSEIAETNAKVNTDQRAAPMCAGRSGEHHACTALSGRFECARRMRAVTGERCCIHTFMGRTECLCCASSWFARPFFSAQWRRSFARLVRKASAARR